VQTPPGVVEYQATAAVQGRGSGRWLGQTLAEVASMVALVVVGEEEDRRVESEGRNVEIVSVVVEDASS
jgi:hypothetical protein